MDPVGKKLLDIAKDQLGYTEKGDGYTKFGDWYAKNIDGDHDSYFKTAPWCDMFLAWAADKAGVQDSAGQFASTIDHAKWFKKQDAWGTKPEPGAIVFFDWSGSHDVDQIDHVGIVEKVDGSTLTTIEGNNGGYKLARATRDMDQVVGFGYPGKVKVATETTAKYAPRHAAPAPTVEHLTPDTGATNVQHDKPVHHTPLPNQEMILGGLLALVLCGTVALAAGKAAAAMTPTSPPVRVRKRGKHHRVTPVELPAEITPAVLEEAETATTIMPALSLAAAHEAEDREFWGRIAPLAEDEELSFWDSLHAESTLSTAARERAEYATTPGFR
ncbi:CHAP domain-containing protein [Actinomadura barringtoniae]|uniref:CHAP domain-containing protein n=1 Tax=Actinomadura barringtoniae TaxID=1427535 RepID=A0A939PKB9_9ACTN|nr:CHAP domain-containing protein [Actinomadura barringtoniae]MBO2450754.1 CHAP domain-containing protein [Actinomadura barringtoniae]